jgi:hypothetical protein
MDAALSNLQPITAQQMVFDFLFVCLWRSNPVSAAFCQVLDLIKTDPVGTEPFSQICKLSGGLELTLNTTVPVPVY